VPSSVIVKLRRPESLTRSAPAQFYNERAALEFLTTIGSDSGPRLLAADDAAGLLVMEDLGTGPALEDLLVGSDFSSAEQGFVAFARALGRMHATSAGHADEYYRLRSTLGPVDPAFGRVSILGIGIEAAWSELQAIVAARPYLPAPQDVQTDVDELLRVLVEPGPYLAIANGDLSPGNCRMLGGVVRFIDFEHACFRHALLDAAALHFTFPACPCWSRIPEDVAGRAEDAYRQEMACACPAVLDQASYAPALTSAWAAWTIVRAIRLPKLEHVDAPHPMGFSRRGQLLDNIATAVSCADQSRTLQSFASWLADLGIALRARWPYITAAEPLYPAFQGY